MSTDPTDRKSRSSRARMSGRERREQLIGIGRRQFAERGFEGATGCRGAWVELPGVESNHRR